MNYKLSIRDKRNISANCYFSDGASKDTYIKKLLGKKVNKIIKAYRNYKFRKINIEYKRKLNLLFCKYIPIADDIIHLIFEKIKYLN